MTPSDKNLKISFVIPAYNEEACIADCFHSIEAELRTGNFDAEVIIVNNASTDKTRSIAEQFTQFQIVDEPKKGLVFARKAGFDATTGDLIANIDADTRLPKGWLSFVMQTFENDPELVALSGPFIYTDLSTFNRILVKLFYGLGYSIHSIGNTLFAKGAMLQGGNFIVRRDALIEIGGYDTSIVFYGEDTDIARRIR